VPSRPLARRRWSAGPTRLQVLLVLGAVDGDTLTVLREDKATYRIRLHGIDAPEKALTALEAGADAGRGPGGRGVARGHSTGPRTSMLRGPGGAPWAGFEPATFGL
jgi:hypothetical protein